MSDTPKVYIVEDDPSNMALLVAYLDELNYEIKTYESGVQFLESCHLEAPGCILLDNLMPEMSGIEVQSRVIALDSRLPVIFMSGLSSYEDVFAATQNGALAFMQKPISRAKARSTVEQAIALSRELTEKFAAIAKARTLFASLTDREIEVFRLLVDGQHNKMIAKQLDISLRTVEYHRSNIQKKLHANFLSDLISLAKRLDL